jgi:hypothetical protein
LLTVASGCFLDEIDKSSAGASHMGPVKTAGDAAAPASTTNRTGAAPEKTAAADKPAAAIGPAWWKSARTLGSDKSDTTIAQCELPGGSGYMRREDCLLRGGRPQ